MGTAAKKSDACAEIEQFFGRVPEWVRQIPESAVEIVSYVKQQMAQKAKPGTSAAGARVQ